MMTAGSSARVSTGVNRSEADSIARRTAPAGRPYTRHALPSLERRKILGLGHRKFGEAPAKAASQISDRVGPVLGDLYEEGRRPPLVLWRLWLHTCACADNLFQRRNDP